MNTISQEKLTAYALNELPENERQELEMLLEQSPENLEFTEETRDFCQLLQQTIGSNEPEGLSDSQKADIAKTIPFAATQSRRRWPVIAFGTSAAAAVAVWLSWPHISRDRNEDTHEFLPGGGGGGRSVAARSSSTPAQNSKRAEVAVSTPTSRDLSSIVDAKEAADAPSATSLSTTFQTKGKADASSIQNITYTGGTTVTSGTLAASPGKPAETAHVDRLYAITAPEPATPQEERAIPAATLAKATPDAAGYIYPTVDPSKLTGTNNPEGLSIADAEAKPAAAQPATAGREVARPAVTLATATTAPAAAPAAVEYRYKVDPAQTADFSDGITRADSFAPRNPTAESYVAPPENPFKQVAAEPLSTFSIDVDTASYANVRRFLNMGQRPPAEAIRVEELINYFRYAYPAPEAGKPCSLTADLVVCPWNEHHRLARVALKARVDENRPKANLVFLLDVSGSMSDSNKLPLVKQSLKLLVDKLTENDRVSIVVYAGASGLVLAPTHGENKTVILSAIDNLQPGGSTNGASGITLAYEQARKEFIKDGVNRVILATDGDFNVGISDREGLQSLIEKEAKSGVFLSVLGYGMGNLKDSTMETLADKGNGNYAYIDSLGEARKVLSEEMSSTLVTVAKDVKIQIEFNPSKVRAYKLLGYENRMLAKEDFNDDKKDAGEMGAGHTVTALYEITPTDAPPDVAPVDPLKYQTTAVPAPKVADAPRIDSPEVMTVKLRYKAPDADVSQLMELPVLDRNAAVASAPGDFQFATAVAGYGLLLRGSKQVGNLNWEMIRQMAKAGKGEDAEGYRGEFLQLLEKAAGMAPLR